MAAGAPAAGPLFVNSPKWPVGLPVSVLYHADGMLYGCVVADADDVEAVMMPGLNEEWNQQARCTRRNPTAWAHALLRTATPATRSAARADRRAHGVAARL